MSQFDGAWDTIIAGLVTLEQQALANGQIAVVSTLEDQINAATANKAAGLDPDNW